MNTIREAIKDLLEQEPQWISRLTEYPQEQCVNLTPEQKDFFKEINTYELCDTVESYEIVKILFVSRGIRSVNPVWYFIHYERFKKDKIIIKTDHNNVIQVKILHNIEVNHFIQKVGTLQLYYALLTNEKIGESLIDNDSEFTKRYKEFNELWKYLYIPRVEVSCGNGKYIDMSYDCNNIIDNINIEINEKHHKKVNDRKRESGIWYWSKNRIVNYYVMDNSIDFVIDNIFFRLTKGIYKVNKYAGLAFNAYVKNIIENLSTSVFFSELKRECLAKTLTWSKFREYCSMVNIIFDNTYIKIIEDDLSDDEEERTKELNEYFHNFKGLNSKAILTETGCDRYLMALKKKHTSISGKIKNMYSRYKQEYEKLMDEVLTDNDDQELLLREYVESDEYILSVVKKKFSQT